MGSVCIVGGAGPMAAICFLIVINPGLALIVACAYIGFNALMASVASLWISEKTQILCGMTASFRD